MTGDRTAAIRELRKLVEEEKDLYVGNNDDSLLVQYLAFADNDVERAFEKMKTVFRLKAEHSEYFAFRRDPELHDVILKKGIHVLLGNRDQLGRRIYVLKLKHIAYGEFQPHQMFQVDDLWLSLVVDEPETQENGLTTILDMKETSWKLLGYFTPNVVRVSSSKAENLPLKKISYHVVNAGLVINAMVKIVFPFLSQATKESIYFHKNFASLHEHIAPSALPEEYGGELPPIDNQKLVKEFLDKRSDRLSEILSYGYRTTDST